MRRKQPQILFLLRTMMLPYPAFSLSENLPLHSLLAVNVNLKHWQDVYQANQASTNELRCTPSALRALKASRVTKSHMTKMTITSIHL